MHYTFRITWKYQPPPVEELPTGKRPKTSQYEGKYPEWGFRYDEPTFPDHETARRWYTMRRRVMDHLLQLIHDSRWKDHFVLRGSLLLQEWMGDAAREPEDIDFVFRPIDLSLDQDFVDELAKELEELFSTHPSAGRVLIETDYISVEDIGDEYAGVLGSRFTLYWRVAGLPVFPWRDEYLPAGRVQMDIAFDEELWQECALTPIPKVDGGSTLLWSVSKELSLAWKLLWLARDESSQMKDLYDAMLLAEQTYLPLSLLKKIFQADNQHYQVGLNEVVQTLKSPYIRLGNWKAFQEFQEKYPFVDITATECVERLYNALGPTLTEVALDKEGNL